jgi:putative spermidine/putrescine transport system permease protein
MTRRRLGDLATEFLSIVFFRNRWALLVMLALPASVLLALFFLPHLGFLRTSFWTVDGTTLVPATTIDNYRFLIETPFYRGALWQSIRLSLTVAMICLAVGYPVALILTRVRLRFRTLVAFILFTPMFVSVVIRSFGWLVLLERQGVVNVYLMQYGLIEQPLRLLNNFTGVVVGMVNVMLVFMVIPLVSSLSGIPRDLDEAARTLGASRLRSWWHVTWPLSAPGVITGFLLVFVITLSSYVLPRLLGGATFFIYPIQMWRQVMSVLNWPLGAAMGVVLLIVAFLASRLVSLVAHVVFPYYGQTLRRRGGAKGGR